ncbi:MAG: nucleotidyltransferase family protein [Gammaproteobacteria bacterium]|nr:nucleotidyltransferase family protein [Gammaproteobacteria bacterium]MCY4356591.1 nucleotidyltransferase family protein [Gammaproteobacteria bacterium]
MQAMILAAGLGTRMQTLTADTPKPLLKVGNTSLIEHLLQQLVAAGVTEVVINLFYLGSRIEEDLGNGSRFGLDIQYSREAIRLDTAGGIIKALPLLNDDSFIVVNADILTDFNYATLKPVDGLTRLAHIVLVQNPDHRPEGDFYINEDGHVYEEADVGNEPLTFSGISVLHRDLFADLPVQPCSVVPLLRQAMQDSKVSGEVHTGHWIDVGSPQRLAEANRWVRHGGMV